MGDFVQLTVSNSQNDTICMEKKFPKDISISNLKVGLSVCLSVFIQFVSKIGLTVLARSFLLRCLRSESNCVDCVWSVCGMAWHGHRTRADKIFGDVDEHCFSLLYFWHF